MTHLQKSKNNKRDPKHIHSKTCSSHENSIYTSGKTADFSDILSSPKKIPSGSDARQFNNLMLSNAQRSDIALQINRLQGNRFLQEFIVSSNNNYLNTLQKQTNTQSSSQIPPAVTNNPDSETDNKATNNKREQLYKIEIGSDLFQGVTKAQAIRLLWKHYHRLSGWVVAEKGGHKRLIEINKEHWIIGAVANEFAGRINAVQPPISVWSLPEIQLASAKSKLTAGNIEGGLDSLLEAERKYNLCHKWYYMWKNGTIEGAERAVTTLKVTAVVGAIAATIATGGMAAAAEAGLVGVSLAAGAGAGWYGISSEAGKQAGESIVGMREEADIKAILSRGATDFVTGFVGAITGGALSKVFMKAFGPYIASISDDALATIGRRMNLSIDKVRELMLNYISDFLGGIGSSPATTATQVMMTKITDPSKAPKTAGDFVHLVVEEMVKGGIIQLFLGGFMHTYGVKTSSGKPMSPADLGVTQPVPEAFAPTVKAPTRGSTTESAPPFERASTIKAPPRRTSTEPAPPFEHAETIKAPAKAKAQETLPPIVEGETGLPTVRPKARKLNPAEFEDTKIDEGINTGKRMLKDKTTGEEFLFKPSEGEVPIIGEDIGIVAGERYRRVPAAAEVGKQLGFETPSGEVVQFGGELGSLQKWVRQGQTLESLATSRIPVERKLYQEIKNSQLKKDMDVFDYLIANMDRNPGNLKVVIDPKTGKVSKLIPIDMDAAFPPSEVRNSPYFLEGVKTLPAEHISHQKPLPNTMTQSLFSKLLNMKSNKSRLENVLRKFLTDQEVKGMFSRLDEILSKVASKEVIII